MIRRVLLDCCWSGSGKGARAKFPKNPYRTPKKRLEWYDSCVYIRMENDSSDLANRE
jgi:hypothetical protein